MWGLVKRSEGTGLLLNFGTAVDCVSSNKLSLTSRDFHFLTCDARGINVMCTSGWAVVKI